MSEITQILEIPRYIGILWKTKILRKMKIMPKIAKIAIKALRCSFIGIVLQIFATGCGSVSTYEQNIIPERLKVQSPWFYVSEDDVDLQESYVGFNPQTQQRITVPEKVVPAFKPGKNLKDIVARKLRAVQTGSGLKARRV